MQSKIPLNRFVEENDTGDLRELRQDLIIEIGAGIILAAWIVMTSAVGYGGKPITLIVALQLFVVALISIWQRNKRYTLALYLIIGGLICATATHKLLFPQGWAQFFFPIAVVVSGLLVSNFSVFAVAGVASLVCLAAAGLAGFPLLDGMQVWIPILLVQVTAFASWLSSRQVHAALGWMQTSYAQAREWLEQLRNERMAQARTIKILEEAYSRIEKLNYQLTEARMAAEEARKMKAEFAANISHELRTPLNMIIGFSETMANAPETYEGVRWTPIFRGDVEEIYRSSRHLSALIDDILDLSAMEVRRLGLNLEEADISRVVEEAAAVMRGLYHAKRLYLKIDTQPDLPLILMDATRIRQVLINLLSNASRFTTSGGVTITTRMEKDAILITVADTGVGIAPRDIPRVFEEFGQVDGSLTRAHEGTGLGVPLSKRLVEMHGGEMWLESKPGSGTVFYFTLPWSYAPLKSLQSVVNKENLSLPRQRNAYRQTILVMEADPLLLRTMRRQLNAYDLVEVTDPSSLPDLVARHQPAALIVDNAETSHYAELEQTLANLPADLPVLSAALQGSLRVARELGIQNYLVKPVSREQLLDALDLAGEEIRRVLIVDNEGQIQELFRRMLESAGDRYETLKAGDGAEALRILGEEQVDLLLLDLLMPGMNGMEVLREMKRDERLARVPVIMISGQYPVGLTSSQPLSLQLFRQESASLAETFNYLERLLEAMPKGKMPHSEAVLTPPEAGDAPRAS